MVSFATEIPDGQELTVLIGTDGRLWGRLYLAFDGSGFDVESYDEPILEDAVRTDTATIRLTDRLTEQQAEMLDYGQAVICLCPSGADESDLQPFCTVPAHVTPQGEVQADFSGLLLRIDGFVVHTAENDDESVKALLSLSGEAVFYAEATFQTISGEKTQELVSSAELDGTWENVPRTLFDTATLTSITISLKNGIPVTTGGESRQLPLQQPLKPELIPAVEVGSFGWYFEYFFMDGTDEVHAFQKYSQE